MYAIQFKHEGEWRTCVRDISTSALQVYRFKDEAEKEFKKYKDHPFEHRVVEMVISALNEE